MAARFHFRLRLLPAAIRRWLASPILQRLIGPLRLVANWTPLTATGLGGGLAMVWLWLSVVGPRQDRVLQALVLAGLAMLLLTSLLVLAVALWLKRQPQQTGEPLDLLAGTTSVTQWRAPGIEWIPWLKLDVCWLSPASSEVRCSTSPDGVIEEVVIPERGEFPGVVRQLTVRDVFGLSKARFEWTTSQPVTITPASGRPAPLPEFLQHRAGDGFAHPHGSDEGDLMESRSYAAGDPLKRIHWKVFARTRRLMVRLPEKSLTPSERLVACFVAGEGDEPTAGLARSMLEHGQLGGDFVFCADGAVEPTSNSEAALRQIVRSVQERRAPGTAFDVLNDAAFQTTQDCLVFAPSRRGPWVNRLRDFSRCRSVSPRVLIGIDHSPETELATSWSNWMWQHSGSECGDLDELRAVCADLQDCGLNIHVFDRRSGQEMTSTLV